MLYMDVTYRCMGIPTASKWIRNVHIFCAFFSKGKHGVNSD